MNNMRIIAAAGVILAGLSQVSYADPPNGIRAVVHESVITSDEVDRQIIDTARRLSLQYGSQPEVFQSKLNELSSSKLDELLARQLILHEFKVAGYNLPESVIDE